MERNGIGQRSGELAECDADAGWVGVLVGLGKGTACRGPTGWMVVGVMEMDNVCSLRLHPSPATEIDFSGTEQACLARSKRLLQTVRYNRRVVSNEARSPIKHHCHAGRH